ncbi:Structure-specific endonuclease subunit slx1 [Glycine soja]
MMGTLSTQFRSIKRPNPNPKLSKSSSPTKSEIKFIAKPKPKSESESESWSVYLILSTNHPIKTYVGITNNFPRRLKQHNGELKGGAKASRAGRPWICACIICGFTDRSEDSSVDQFPELVIPVPSSDMTTACTSSYPSSNPAKESYTSVFESKWKTFSRRAPRKNQNDNLSKQSEDSSLPLLRHRQAALNRVKGSLDCAHLEIIWHLDPL